ncbi:MAG: translation initiation factor IF-2, partial [Chloroflexi bacterium]|nr:translation initiation factor IF-2 [Chloroflexota bacterium]
MRNGRPRRARPAQAIKSEQPEIAAPMPDGSAGELELPHTLTVKDLAEAVKSSPVEIIKVLMKNGVMANINQTIDFDTAAIVASDLGFNVVEQKRAPEASAVPSKVQQLVYEDASQLRHRPPVVTILGHVDHGKTKLLDAIRKTNVIESEAGGITQHIGAYQVEVHGQKITFLDTPGHEAFTAMRARGAQVTDIAVLVTAADDGVMPQTVEAINHARAAGVPIVVAINKIDKPEANPERVKQQLADHGLIIEEWGGDVICVPVSAKMQTGINELLDNLLVVAEVADLKANPSRRAVGTILEASLDNTKGPMATVLVSDGTLKVGDVVVVDDITGHVKAMFNDQGKHVRRAEPATPAKILGLNAVPQAGASLVVVADDKAAKALVQKYLDEKQSRAAAPTKIISLDDLFGQLEKGHLKELNVILKTDVEGSIEPIRASLERLSTDKVKVKVLHSGSGNITESDVLLAIASKAIVIGFNSRPEPGARRLADAEGVDIRFYSVIYNLVDDIQKAMVGLLEPVFVEAVDGHAEVRAVFQVGRKSSIAGVYITDGRVVRGHQARIVRAGSVIHTSSVNSLRHFKDDVREMAAGNECGIVMEGFQEFA